MGFETVGKYEIRGQLGAGAMGTVLDAFDPVIERRAALKIINKPSADDAEGAEAMARFKREAQAAGRLNHPNIVAVYDYGEDATHAWIAMELVEGGTLKQVLDRGERFPLAETLRVMEEVLAGLDYSHKRGVVHRDIKPANIMLTADGTVKIADFGIARLENSSMTQVGTVMGTPSYMAPEQLRGETVDARADIWAAGVMFYQLLTGEKPFEGGFSSVLHKAINTEPTPASTLSVTAPRAFDAVISRALAKRPEDRFATAAAFADALRPAMAAPAPPPPDPDATVVATPPRPAAPPAPPPVAAKPAAAEPKKGIPVALIGGGVAVLVAAGAALFVMRGGGDPAASPPAATTAALTPAPVTPVTPSLLTPATPSQGVLTPSAPAPSVLVPAAQAPGVAAPPPSVSIMPVAPAPMAPVWPAPVSPAPVAASAVTPPPATPTQASPTPGVPAPVVSAPPAPLPATPPQQQLALVQPARPDFRAAAAAAAAAPACGLIATAATDTSLALEGVLRRGEEASLRQLLAARDIPGSAARLAVQPFDGPYCPAMDLLRPVLAAVNEAPRVGLVGSLPLANGQLLRFDVTMPDWPAHLYVAYFMQSGEVAHLVPSATHPAGAVVRLGEPRAGFPGWEVSEPFGTDLMVAVVSEGPLFNSARPLVEPQEAYLAALRDALLRAGGAGRRVLVRPFVIETVSR